MSKIILQINILVVLFSTCASHPDLHKNPLLKNINFHETAIINRADSFLLQSPTPITLFSCKRSAGTINDFYSEGDYWWPDPKNPDSAYIRRDGLTNPDNFTQHRIAMRNLNKWVSTLVTAFKISGNEKYAKHALKHLYAFFIDPLTRMNPSLLYAQAIKGKVKGRGIGIIDTIHLIEVARAIEILIQSNTIKNADKKALKKWFNDYAEWMNTHEFGLKEKYHGNNHSTWWAAQIAAFAHLSDREDLMAVARNRFKALLSKQMDQDGKFPDELKRTKPYIYSLFNLEGYAVLCEIASTKEENLWNYEGENGSIQKAWNFMMPYIKDKTKWMYPPDVRNFDQVPIQSSGLFFAAIAYKNEKYLDIWNHLNPKRKSKEINRNFPIREPLLWVKH